MKALRVLGVLLFLLTTVVGSASAARTTVGFIPMLTRVDPNVSIQVQAGHAYDRMLGKILELQASGVISEFQPSFAGGVLQVKYAAGARLSDVAGSPVYSDINSAIAAMPQLSTARGEAMASPKVPAPWVKLWLYDNCFESHGLGAAAHLVGILQDATLRTVATYQGDANSTGDINSACFSTNGSFADVMPGYKAIFKVYTNNTLATLKRTLSKVAPTITFTSIDNATADVEGTGPAGSSIGVYWEHENLDAADNYTTQWIDDTITGGGTWSEDMSATSFRGADWLSVRVPDAQTGVTFSYGMNVPWIYCVLGGYFCNLHGFAFQAASFTITHSGTPYPATGTFDSGGYFTETLTGSGGDPIFLAVGDLASGSGGASDLYLPNLTAAVNFSTNIVSGKSPKGKYLFSGVNVPYPADTWYYKYVKSKSSGNYSANFTSQVDLKANRGANLEAYFIDPTTGNRTDYYYTYSP